MNDKVTVKLTLSQLKLIGMSLQRYRTVVDDPMIEPLSDGIARLYIQKRNQLAREAEIERACDRCSMEALDELFGRVFKR